MEASGRTPHSPTHRIQTVIQVSTQDHRTSALWEQRNLAGSSAASPTTSTDTTLQPLLSLSQSITASSAKPIELRG